MTYNSITTFSDSRSSPTRPSIIEVVEQSGVHLRRAGREFTGLCPFHSEKIPSFTVSEEKGLFYCHGCGEGGDVISFVMKKLDMDFKTALVHLELDSASKPGRMPRKRPEKQAANAIAEWVQEMANRIGDRMRVGGQRGHMARKAKTIPGTDESFLDDEISRCDREWSILETMQEDLFDETLTMELWSERESLETIIHE